jgi:uncharacterized SAM-binding protein YcdF (DUF218 family)
LVATVVFILHGPILTWVGRLLVVEDELVEADVILPLAGGTLDREIEAAELFRKGFAPRIVLTREPKLPTLAYLGERGIHLPVAEEVRLRVLVELGVPRERISFLAGFVRSTMDEAEAVAAWAVDANIGRVIVVSSPYHTARAKHTFERFAGNGLTQFIVRPTRLSGFSPDNWWTRRDTLRLGIVELEKLLAYRLW